MWRVGGKVQLNVYDGDRPVCQCHTAEDAAKIVEAMNYSESPRAPYDVSGVGDWKKGPREGKMTEEQFKRLIQYIQTTNALLGGIAGVALVALLFLMLILASK